MILGLIKHYGLEIPIHHDSDESPFVTKSDLKQWKRKLFKELHTSPALMKYGLCDILFLCGRPYDLSQLVCKYSKSWKKASDNHTYPINITKLDPYTEFNSVPHWTGRQLRARKELLNHIIRSMNEVEYL